MYRSFSCALLCTLLLLAAAFPAAGVDYIQAPPLAASVKTAVGAVSRQGAITVPVITWGGDIATIHANGDQAQTASGSLFAKEKLALHLVRMDNFPKQVEAYLQGKTPYLRGTLGMINMASELLAKDSRTKPVVIYQHTWSTGGDCLVVKEGIQTAKDLKGKTIALQAYGPHVDYLATLLRDSGLKLSDVKLKWVPDLSGTANSPAEALYDSDVDGVMVIIPDGLMLTSDGTVGTGAEGSVKGARIMLSTKSANRIIADVYAVRSDFFTAHRQEVQAFVRGLLSSQEQTIALFKERKNKAQAYQQMVRGAAKVLLASESSTGDVEALYHDCQYVGLAGNKKFFADMQWPRNFSRLNAEIQSSLVVAGLLRRSTPMAQADWDYQHFTPGEQAVADSQEQRFNTEAVAKVVAKKQAMGTLAEGELFSFEVFFQPNQNAFSADKYADAFKRVIELASTYGGAIITIEGHSDPLGYLRKQKEHADEIVLRRTQQAAKNLSLTRAIAVRDAVSTYAKDQGISLDASQFTVVGHGISQPKTGLCGAVPCAPKTKEEWLSNMRVVFRIIQIEAEESVFRPLE